MWRDAIRRALAKKGREIDPNGEGAAWERGLLVVAEKFIEACANGEAWALRDLGDRMDGKPAQSLTVSGDGDNPLVHRVERVVVRSPDSGS